MGSSRVRSIRAGLLLALLLAIARPSVAQTAVSVEGVSTVEFYSPAVDRTMKYNIVLPYGYEEDTDIRYPVLYLLHGLTQNYTVWAMQGVPFYAGMYNVIVVMPDGGNSWYVNYAESSGDQKNDWEDHIIEDVIGHVDSNYRTIASREGRAITGLSMGGYGAITLGLRHPEMFVSIGTTSGALEYGREAAARLRAGEVRERPDRSSTPNAAIGIPGFSSQAERTPLGRDFVTAEQADAYDPFVLIQRVPPDQVPHIYIDCGTEDGLIDGARELASILIQKNLPFDYMQQAGRHNGEYWTRSVGRIISVQYEVMRRALGERPVAVRIG
jgi:putative tributyrin esterase